MDLELSPHYAALQAEVREFLASHGHKAPPYHGARKKPDRKALDWHRLLVERGYALRTVPREYGGYGGPVDLLEAAVIADTFSEAGIPQGLASVGINMLVPTLLEVGTEEQRRLYIPPTIQGEMLWCQGYSEPEAGSDLASLRTSAHVDGGEFVINGQKIWTSGANYADMMFLLCRTEPDLPKHQGISYILVPMGLQGMTVRPLRTMTGRTEVNEVFFDNVRVPVENLVMGRGDGWKVANVTLKHERLYLGDANKIEFRLRKLVRLMRETGPSGRPAMETAAFRERLLRIQGEALAWRAHQMRLRTASANGADLVLERLIVKYGGAMLCWRICALALDAFGPEALLYDPEWSTEATEWNLDYMNDMAIIIGGGSANIQKNVIAERGLGLPREPKPEAKGAAHAF